MDILYFGLDVILWLGRELLRAAVKQKTARQREIMPKPGMCMFLIHYWPFYEKVILISIRVWSEATHAM
jgi:hypothetical protein